MMSQPVERKSELPWRVPVAVHEVPVTGRRFELSADARVRAAIAKLAGVNEMPRLDAVFDVIPYKGGGLRVAGTVTATIGQTCVVTVEPMQSQIEEQVDLVFSPDAAAAPTSPEVEIIGEDPPEPLVGDSIDLGAIAIEFLVLAVDPYPRKPGAVFESPAAGETAASHPFAALAALKKRQDDK